MIGPLIMFQSEIISRDLFFKCHSETGYYRPRIKKEELLYIILLLFTTVAFSTGKGLARHLSLNIILHYCTVADIFSNVGQMN